MDESQLAVWEVESSPRSTPSAWGSMTEQQNARSHAHLPERCDTTMSGRAWVHPESGRTEAGRDADRRHLLQQPDRVSKPHCPGGGAAASAPRIQVWGHRDGRWSPVSSYLRGLEPWQAWPGPPSVPYSLTQAQEMCRKCA